MKAVLQVVSQAAVAVDGKTVGEIQKGFLIFLGVSGEDNEEVTEKMAD